MKAVYKILTNQDKVTMKYFNNIKCDPDLGEDFCAMWRIPCDCTGCVERISNPWWPNLDKTLQPRYAIKPKTCKHSSILRGYNKWYICLIDFKKETTNPKEMNIKEEIVQNSMTCVGADEIEKKDWCILNQQQ